MMFRDLKVGDTLYIYDRASIALTAEQVSSVSAPRVDKSGMVVDVAVGNMTYTFRDSSEVGFTPTLVISADRNNLLREVEAHKMGNESQIARVDQLKAELPKLDAIIDQLSPERKQKKDQEARMAKMEKSIGDLTAMLTQFMNSSNTKQNGSK